MKTRDPILDDPEYRPDFLIGDLLQFFNVGNHNQLAACLDLDPAQICRVLKKKELIGARMIVRILDHTGWTIIDLRERTGMPFVNKA
jgi:plasmid maintenance system antidote protein VapI